MGGDLIGDTAFWVFVLVALSGVVGWHFGYYVGRSDERYAHDEEAP